MGLNDNNIGNDSHAYGSTWTVETNVSSSNSDDLSSRGISLPGKTILRSFN